MSTHAEKLATAPSSTVEDMGSIFHHAQEAWGSERLSALTCGASTEQSELTADPSTPGSVLFQPRSSSTDSSREADIGTQCLLLRTRTRVTEGASGHAYRQDTDGPVLSGGGAPQCSHSLCRRTAGKRSVQKPMGMLGLPMGSSYKRGAVTGEEEGGPSRNSFGCLPHT